MFSLLSSRDLSAKRVELELIANSPLDGQRWEETKSELRATFDVERKYVKLLQHLGLPPRDGGDAEPSKIRCAFALPRASLNPNVHAYAGYGHWMGSHTAGREAVQIFSRAEKLASSGESLKVVAMIPQAIGTAIAALRERGYMPNLIILPHESRFASALFRKPLWEVRTRDGFQVETFGVYDGLLVAKWPYIDPHSIMVADSTQLFREVKDARDAEVILEDSPQAAVDTFRRQVAEAKSPEELPDISQLTAEVKVEVVSSVSVADPNAGIALRIDESDGMYAMVPNEKTDHRTSCAELKDRADVIFSLLRKAPDESQDRTPCGTCRPDWLDSELSKLAK